MVPVPPADTSLTQLSRKVISKTTVLILIVIASLFSLVFLNVSQLSTQYNLLVDEMLEILTCKSVIVKDIFRLGRYVSSGEAGGTHRPRPILIKLTNPVGS